MYRTTITLAGLVIGVEHQYASFRTFAQAFLGEGEKTDFTVTVTDADIEKERRYYARQCASDGQNMGTVDGALLEQTAVYRRIAENLTSYNAVVFHGAAVAVGDRAVLFSALSGTGKTTHAKLWLKNIDGSFIVDGDKPILRMIGQTVYVCGTPWNGKEHFGTNKNVPLTAICRIQRSLQNRVERVSASAFLPHLLQQTHCPEQGGMAAIVPVIRQLTTDLAFYNLYCNMDDEAALLSHREIMP